MIKEVKWTNSENWEQVSTNLLRIKLVPEQKKFIENSLLPQRYIRIDTNTGIARRCAKQLRPEL